jgi:hypothetical protein
MPERSDAMPLTGSDDDMRSADVEPAVIAG